MEYPLVASVADDESVSEEQCSLCADIAPSERAAFREGLERIPLHHSLCDACLTAFWNSIPTSRPKPH